MSEGSVTKYRSIAGDKQKRKKTKTNINEKIICVFHIFVLILPM